MRVSPDTVRRLLDVLQMMQSAVDAGIQWRLAIAVDPRDRARRLSSRLQARSVSRVAKAPSLSGLQTLKSALETIVAWFQQARGSVQKTEALSTLLPGPSDADANSSLHEGSIDTHGSNEA